MTSLSEVYTGEGRNGPGLRRLSLGLALFVAGSVLVVAAIVVTASDLLLNAGWGLGEVRELGGVLAGVGVPAVFLGVFTVLPSSRLTRAAAVIGASVAMLGVALFVHAYPCKWSGATCGTGANLTLPTVTVYFFGMLTTFWCLFVGVANFKTRNDPGGTATVNVTKKGETRVVEVSRSGGLGGIGFLGSTPDGNVETQTNTGRPSPTGGSPAGVGTTDGGATAQQISSPLDGPRERPDVSDHYCGNCTHFEYVRTDDGIQPFCQLNENLMDDMDACEEWTSRRE